MHSTKVQYTSTPGVISTNPSTVSNAGDTTPIRKGGVFNNNSGYRLLDICMCINSTIVIGYGITIVLS